jgi:hypothetical protein
MSKPHFVEGIEPRDLDATPTPKRPITAAFLSCLLISFDVLFPSYVDNWNNIDYLWLCSTSLGLALTIYGIYMSWDFGEESTDGKLEVDLTPTTNRVVAAAILSCLLLSFDAWILTWTMEWNIGHWIWLFCVNTGWTILVCVVYGLVGQAETAPADAMEPIGKN